MRRRLSIVIVTAAALVFSACAAPTPQVVEKAVPQTVVVEKQVPVEKQVVQTVVVEKEKVVEKLVTAAPAPATSAFQEAPALASLVARGQLPPVDQRVPKKPYVARAAEIGRYGGTLLKAFAKVYPQWAGLYWGYAAKLIGRNDRTGEMWPQLVESYDKSADAKTYTFHLREGMRWSDGEPVTADDFAFWYEDMLHNEEITPTPPAWFGVESKDITFTKLDPWTVKYEFAQSAPLMDFAFFSGGYDVRGTPVQPAHYLKQFHKKYADPAALEAVMKNEGFTGWVDLFNAKHDYNNPDKPVITPWLPTGKQDDPIRKWVRNPYFWAIDAEGNQLPYIDEIEISLVPDADSQMLKTFAGENYVDAVSGLGDMPNYSLIVENAKKGNYRLVPGIGAPNSASGIDFNYANPDPVKKALYNDLRFRIALSVAINRDEINQAIFDGLGRIHQMAPAYGEPWHGDDPMYLVHTEYDPAKANRLLDEIGLTKRDKDGFRLGTDGKDLVLNVTATSGWPGEAVEIMDIVRQHWEKVGIKAVVKPSGDTFIDDLFSGNPRLDIAVRTAYSVGPGIHPSQAQFLFFLTPNEVAPAWVKWFNTGGKEGDEPPAEVKRIRELWQQSRATNDLSILKPIIAEAGKIYADNLYSINVINYPPESNTYVLSTKLRNISQDEVFGSVYTATDQTTWYIE